ncbi:uncharacterized protein LOC121733963 [Aricia agestis]|uniref:uncharacterized protein LOC121733963 n=1 Tax=Aricia agestis TaxID=91739 RepID=UPI001C2061C5|nr:uncharacterized protein LOC121733963 [Aricia agestis]
MRRAPAAALLRLLVVAGGILFVNPYSDERVDLSEVWVEVPSPLVALGGDVHMRVRGAPGGALRVRLAREDDEGRALLATMPLTLDSDSRLTIPCGYFSRGGIYYIEIVADKEYVFEDNSTIDAVKVKRDVSGVILETGEGIIKTWKFDVLWPPATLDVTPEQIQTYPERQVTAILEFPKAVCAPLKSNADFWLELLYCGHSSGGAVLCDGRNTSSHAHVLYSEQIHGFPGRRTMTLRCELFGQAGDYALTLRPAAAARDLVTAFIKADWSEQFVLNVHGGSVFPCGDGVRALFQYPECALDGADRVRVFGRDADRLRYVAERRVRRGQHTAMFDCRLFSERYPEYCFVYVSQAVTGAVADVRMDCLPTLPLSEGGAGGWGAWSPWSACPAPARCSTRTRSRHRFCDSPPPAYGAKYCEGEAVELAACECTARPWAGDASTVVAEVGAACRCGCVLHLAPVARLLAGSARACPARSFWLLQAEEGLSVRVRFEAVRLPCAGQGLRARDGDSLAAPLLASWDGPDDVVSSETELPTDGGVIELAGGRHILVELRSSDTSERCAGGFLAHATQVEPYRNASAAWSTTAAPWWSGGGGARAAAGALAALAAAAALALAAHSARRTRAYQRAADKESLTDSDACSASLELGTGSRSTLLSEVVGGGVSFSRLLPGRGRHQRLRDDRSQEHREEDQASDGEAEADNASVVSGGSGGSHASGGSGGSHASGGSGASNTTVTPENASSSSAPACTTASVNPSPLRRSKTVSSHVPQIISAPQTTSEITDVSTSITSVSERDSCSEKDKDSMWEKDRSDSRASSSISAATLTNGWYSPALSGVSAARIRDNPKHTKETCNRKLLRSDLSLTSHPEMEIDYYDYEVNNAGSVPGSYLGMDPAFLVWIPPLEEGDIIKEMDETAPVHEDLPKELRPDPGSNTESPEEHPAATLKRNPQDNRNRSNESIKSIRKVIDRGNIIHPLNFSISDLQNFPKLSKRKKKKEDIPMSDLTLTMSPVKVHRREKDETSTLKRINDAREKDDTLKRTTDLSDIKFADENSDSSGEIKFADDSPDSNKVIDRYEVRA